MTRIVDLTDPALQVIDHGTSVMVHMRGGELLVSTATEAYALAAALKQAGWHCEQAAMLRGSRKDRVTALEQNADNEQAHKTWPGGTFDPPFRGTETPATTEHRVIHIPVEDGGSAA